MKCPQKVYRPLRRASPEPRRITDLVRAVAETLPAARDDRMVAVRRVAIVPALNEGPTIARVVREIRAVDPGFEILVIDDGSTDDTQAEAERAGALVARLPYNVGIGGAVQTGLPVRTRPRFPGRGPGRRRRPARPRRAGRLLEPIAADEADMVVGSRFLGAGRYRTPFGRGSGSGCSPGVVSLMVRRRTTDPTSGFRAVNRRGIVLFAADYPHDYPEAESNVVAYRRSLRVVEVPVAMRDREAGRSSITVLRSLYYMIKVILALFISLFRRYPPVVEER